MDTSISLLLLLSLALACGDNRGDGADTAGEGISASGISSSGIDSGFNETGESAGSNDTTIRFDAPTEETGMVDGGDAFEQGCDKVDLLFVIDNSGSMADEQGNLVNSFPAFISEIQTQLADTESYHVGITTTDDYEYNDDCDIEGALVIATGGDDSSDDDCGPYAEGHSYMTEADDLEQTFSCAAQVGTDGDGDERPMQTMQAALSAELNGPDGCNEGFLRDDALLVIVIITDEEDDHEVDGCLQTAQPGSDGEPPEWFAGVIAAKAGLEENVVVLSLIGPPGPDPAECPVLDKCIGGVEGAEVAHRIAEFTEMFTHGFIGRVCAPSYAEFFHEAVAEIQTACDNFVPVG